MKLDELINQYVAQQLSFDDDSFDVQLIEPQVITINKVQAPLYNLNSPDWNSFSLNVISYAILGQQVTINAIALHRLGGIFLMPDADGNGGYDYMACDGYEVPLRTEVVADRRMKLPDGALKVPLIPKNSLSDWRALQPFNKPRYFRASVDTTIKDVDGWGDPLKIKRDQPILIAGFFTGPDGVTYAAPEATYNTEKHKWYGLDKRYLTSFNKQIMEEVLPDPIVPMPNLKRGKIYSLMDNIKKFKKEVLEDGPINNS